MTTNPFKFSPSDLKWINHEVSKMINDEWNKDISAKDLLSLIKKCNDLAETTAYYLYHIQNKDKHYLLSKPDEFWANSADMAARLLCHKSCEKDGMGGIRAKKRKAAKKSLTKQSK